MHRIGRLFVAIAVVGMLAPLGAGAQGGATPVDPTAPPLGTPGATPLAVPSVALVLEPRPGRGTIVDETVLERTRQTLERRLARLGVAGGTVNIRERRVVVAVPAGAVDPETLVPALSEVGLIEIVDSQGARLEPGTLVTTSLGPPPEGPGNGPVYETIVDGTQIAEAFEAGSPDGIPVVGFRLNEAGAEELFAFTSANVGQPLSIVLDKRVLSTPVIQGAIRGEGVIGGLQTPAAVRALVVQLGTEPLPVPLAVVSIDGIPVGATPVSG